MTKKSQSIAKLLSLLIIFVVPLFFGLIQAAELPLDALNVAGADWEERVGAATSSFATVQSLTLAGKTIVLDPGHGGSDPGAVGCDGPGYPDEKDLTLDVVLRLRNLLTSGGARVILTRGSDVDVSLQQRCNIANSANADIFVSVHMNSLDNANVRGTETFYYANTPYDFSKEGKRLADSVQSKIVSKLGTNDRGIKGDYPYFGYHLYVLANTRIPAILTEVCFISNYQDFLMISKLEGRAQCASAVYEGICDYFGSASTTRVSNYQKSGESRDYLSLSSAYSLTDYQKQQAMLGMVSVHCGSLPREVVLAVTRQEGGEGAFHVEGWKYNPFYRMGDAPWAQPANGDGVMQVTEASGYHERSGPYTHSQLGYDHAIEDGCGYLLENYGSYGTIVQTVLHYNSGPNTLYIYLGQSRGDPEYLAHVSTRLNNFVPATYGLSNPAVVNALNRGQNILDRYLNTLQRGRPLEYYRPYQAQLDAELHNVGV
ncbi:MAG TPA: N-acetylmuramoyl-L-alanine amidase [Thermoplasmata archaeon]|nr:N-acetylmuramoyl-L-alanine amidase [Thermoplasmata archaeon]